MGCWKKHSSLMLLAGLILLYELASRSGWLDDFLFPPLERVIPVFYEYAGDLLQGMISSFGLLVPGFGIALVLGILLGVPLGMRRPLRKAVYPILNAMSPLPATLLTPYAIHIFANFRKASIFIISFGAFWPVLNATINGILTIDKRYLDGAATLELKGFRLLTRVILPAASPTIFSGTGTALRFSFILLAVAEMFGANSGMGYFVQYYADFAYFDRVMAGFFFMALILTIVTFVFERIRDWALHWTMDTASPRRAQAPDRKRWGRFSSRPDGK